jgi:hypothetical protein
VPSEGTALYEALKRFELSGGAATVQNLALKRDRVEMTFNGTFYFGAPINGRILGAVFLGNGTLRAEPPNSEFEKANVRRLLKADVVESDFQTAVLRFSDDTFDVIGKSASAQQAPPDAVKLAAEFEPRFMKETGANVSARLALSVLHRETPGFFLAEFDKGKRKRFSAILDHQCRLTVSNFGINGGEKGLIIAYRYPYGNDVWMAFYSLGDYERGSVSYSDAFDLVVTPHYAMDIDLRDPRKAMRVRARMDFVALVDRVVAIPLSLNEDLSEDDDERRKKGLRVRSASMGGTPADVIQEDWEAGLTIVLPRAVGKGEKFAVDLEYDGDFLYDSVTVNDAHYPLSNTAWYPRHGYLNRSTFHLIFRHKKNQKVASVGSLVREEPLDGDKSGLLAEYKLDIPVALITFALGPFEVHKETFERPGGGAIPVEFYSISGSVRAIKEDFILAELGNSVRYFSAMFGAYPYPVFRAAFHPFRFGQGFPTMLVIPDTDRASKYTYSFVAHETAHQWWGDVVAWRSYRDQWLSEGFAEYSGLLYTGLRDKRGAQKDLLNDLRRLLVYPPGSEGGVGEGRLVDVGPIILGHRLSTKKTAGAYTVLIYNKGALVLRMLHFLFTDPKTGDGKAFFDMMGDFVRRHQNGWATTESFIAVANEHFARTPIAQRFEISNLNWFFHQYVYRTELPSYQFRYSITKNESGGAVLQGTLEQTGVPDSWFMALPLVFRLGKDKYASTIVAVLGAKNTFSLSLPAVPDDVQLDPDLWVLSEKTVTRK